jgi:hypothetical protein
LKKSGISNIKKTNKDINTHHWVMVKWKSKAIWGRDFYETYENYLLKVSAVGTPAQWKMFPRPVLYRIMDSFQLKKPEKPCSETNIAGNWRLKLASGRAPSSFNLTQFPEQQVQFDASGTFRRTLDSALSLPINRQFQVDKGRLLIQDSESPDANEAYECVLSTGPHAVKGTQGETVTLAAGDLVLSLHNDAGKLIYLQQWQRVTTAFKLER